MPAYERAKIEDFWQRWLDANAAAERDRDWTQISAFYAEDATYGWMYHPDEHFMAVGRQEINDLALGVEMEGMEGWTYEYVSTVIDDTTGMIVGFWKQHSNVTNAEGEEYEILGIGGSWFGYQENAAGEGEFAGMVPRLRPGRLWQVLQPEVEVEVRHRSLEHPPPDGNTLLEPAEFLQRLGLQPEPAVFEMSPAVL